MALNLMKRWGVAQGAPVRLTAVAMATRHACAAPMHARVSLGVARAGGGASGAWRGAKAIVRECGGTALCHRGAAALGGARGAPSPLFAGGRRLSASAAKGKRKLTELSGEEAAEAAKQARLRLARARQRRMRPRTLFVPPPPVGQGGEFAGELHVDATKTLSAMSRFISRDPSAAAVIANRLGPTATLDLSDALQKYRQLQDAMILASGPGGAAAVASRGVPRPSNSALVRAAVAAAIPFIGFGIVDNAVMIVAGEAFDIYLGAMFGISTMAAAGLGNLISDVGGVGLGGVIEAMAERIGFQPPNISRAQSQMRVTRMATHTGSAIGVAIGCIIGMFPLIWMANPRQEARKLEAERAQLNAREASTAEHDTEIAKAAADAAAKAAIAQIEKYEHEHERGPAGARA